MNDMAWMAYLDTLPTDLRDLAQNLMDRTQTVINEGRILEIEDVQGLEDRAMNQQRQITADELRQDDMDARMDADEAHAERTDDRLDELEHPHEAGR